MCLKVYYETLAIKTFTKFCERAEQCTNCTNPVCKAAKAHGARCEINCCQDELCNSASTNGFSGVLLTSTVLAASFL